MVFSPGVSGNVMGRPRGAAGLARYAAEKTNNGQDMLDILIEIASNPKTPIREKVAAAEAVLSRAVGRPLQETAVSMVLSQKPVFQRPADWDELPAEDRRELYQDWRQSLLGGVVLLTSGSDDEEA